MKFTLTSLVFSLGIFLVSCAPTSSVIKFDDLQTLQHNYVIPAMPTSVDYPDADAVTILDITNVEMKFERYGLYTDESIHVLKKIFKNIEKHSSVDIPIYDGEYLEEITARTIFPDSTEIQLQKNDFLLLSGTGGNNIFYVDVKTIRFTFPSVKSDCYIEYKYRKKKLRPFVSDYWYIQNAIPTMVNQYNLIVPKILMDFGASWKYKPYNYSIDKPIFKTENEQNFFKGKNLYYWEVRNVPSFEPEPFMPPSSQYIAYVKFAPSDWKEWNDVTRWYHKIFYQPQLIINDTVKNLALLLTKDCRNDEERVESLFKYVQKIRYVAISLGDGGIRPNTPSEIIRRQYGDCKDKSILLHSMLWSLNIEAHPILVMTADRGLLDPFFPNWNFNHMIVKAVTKERKTIWLDGTLEYAKAGDLAWNCENINVATIDNDGSSKIEITPQSPHYENIVSISTNVMMTKDDALKFDVHLKYEGEQNLASRSQLSEKSNKELKEYCKEMIADNFLNSTIDTCSLVNVDSLDQPLRLLFTFSAKNGLKRQSDLYFLDVDPFKQSLAMKWISNETRKYPISLLYPTTTRKQITVTFPDSTYILREELKPFVESNENFTYRQIISNTLPNTLTISKVFGIKKAVIDTSHYKETKLFFEKIKNKSEESIILVRKQ